MENAIRIQLPVSVSYTALENLLKKKMTGEYIPRQEEGSLEPPYAKILDVAVSRAENSQYDVALRLKINILRTVLKREQVDLMVLAVLDFDNESQKLFVPKFKLDSQTGSRFYDGSLEVLANKVAYSQIIKKARINIGDIISRELKKANELLEKRPEIKGLKLKGAVEKVSIHNISAQEKGISLLIEAEANIEADIFDLLSLMPPE